MRGQTDNAAYAKQGKFALHLDQVTKAQADENPKIDDYVDVDENGYANE